ncbi:MAG TPA: peptidoglycan-binding domain-containing protein [Beijerinckiaceae bacterium]|jgi:peptidoglycan hydrolase-like protein with peptidoglycan-binding domain
MEPSEETAPNASAFDAADIPKLDYLLRRQEVAVKVAEYELKKKDYELREKEAALKGEDLAVRRQELVMKEKEASRSFLKNPVFWGVAATGLGIVVNAVIANLQELNKQNFNEENARQLKLQEENKGRIAEEKNKTDLLIAAIRTGNEAENRQNLEALIGMKVIRDSDIIKWVEQGKPLPSLPPATAPAAPPAAPQAFAQRVSGYWKRGDTAKEVADAQAFLKAQGFSHLPADGALGAATEVAIKQFERTRQRAESGIVGPWFLEQIARTEQPSFTIDDRSFTGRCLSVVATLEGLSLPTQGAFGLLGGEVITDYGAGSDQLRQLFRSVREKDPALYASALGSEKAAFDRILDVPREEVVALAKSLASEGRFSVSQAWRSRIRELMRSPAAAAFERAYFEQTVHRAVPIASELGFTSERGLCFVADLLVSQGRIGSGAMMASVKAKLATPPEGIPGDVVEVWRMGTVIDSLQSSPRMPEGFRKFLEQRRLFMATGIGDIHGRKLSLARDFGILIEPFKVADLPKTDGQQDPSVAR